MTRLTATIAGHVQGVGFRFATQRIARSFAVTGYVKNLPDGNVLIVAEGAKDEADAFLRAVRQRMADNITHIDRRYGDATGQFEYDEFGIRH